MPSDSMRLLKLNTSFCLTAGSFRNDRVDEIAIGWVIYCSDS